MIKYRKRPIEIEAIQLTEENIMQIYNWMHGGKEPPVNLKHHMDIERWDSYENLVKTKGLPIDTLEGVVTAQIGDWIIKGVKSEFYPCKPDIFEMTYQYVPLNQTTEKE